MKEFEASRLSEGNKIMPNKISIDDFGVTLKIPGAFSGKEKTLSFREISSVKIDSPMIGFSTVTFNTLGWDDLVAKGFSKEDAQEIKQLVQQGISGARSGGGQSGGGNFSNPQVIVQQTPKTAEQILAEAEAEKVKHQIEMEKKAARDKADKEFFDSIKKNWKPISIGVIVLIIGISIFSFFKGNAKLDDAKLSQQLEQIEDKVKLAIQSGDKEKALDLANQLVHPSDENMESQKFDAWSGYPKYDEYWSKKREQYKEQIMQLNGSTIIESNQEQPQNKEIRTEPAVEINNNAVSEEVSNVAKIVYYKVQDPDGYSNLRSSPNGEIIKKVYDTETFEVIGTEGKFKKVRLSDGSEGFIHESRIVSAE